MRTTDCPRTTLSTLLAVTCITHHMGVRVDNGSRVRRVRKTTDDLWLLPIAVINKYELLSALHPPPPLLRVRFHFRLRSPSSAVHYQIFSLVLFANQHFRGILCLLVLGLFSETLNCYWRSIVNFYFSPTFIRTEEQRPTSLNPHSCTPTPPPPPQHTHWGHLTSTVHI